jgi:hypothetical protein
MSITNANGPPVPEPLRIDAFRDGASGADTLHVHPAEGGLQVLGRSAYASGGNQRQVAWVDDPASDASGLFLQALADAYGNGISTRVAREFGLRPAAGQPLCARTVEVALEAAETGRQALAGVDFLTMLEHSTRHDSPVLNAVLRELGIDPARLDSPARQRIDEAMRLRFAEAAASGQSPVPPELARKWMKLELSVLTN